MTLVADVLPFKKSGKSTASALPISVCSAIFDDSKPGSLRPRPKVSFSVANRIAM
jgi:hypothetical protein